MRTGAALLMLALTCFPGLAQENAKSPIPDAAAQKEAEKSIRDIFKEDYARKTTADRQVLAKKLLQQVEGSKDDLAARFVLLREAQELAQQAGDLPTAWKAIDLAASQFQVDPFALRSAALTAAEKAAKTPADLKPIILRYLDFSDEAAAADRFDVAEKAAGTAAAMAKKAKELPLAARADARIKEVASLKARSERLKKARETLAANPEDPVASSLLGHYECAIRGNWEVGLPLLAKGSDLPLKALAELDLSKPTEALVQMSVGDGWWALAEKESKPARTNLRVRAAHWYDQASVRLTGVELSRVERRASDVRTENLMKGTWIDVADTPVIIIPVKKGEPFILDGETGDTGMSAEFPQFTSGVYDGFSVRFKFLGPKTGQVRFRFSHQTRLVWVNGVDSNFAAISRGAGTQAWVTDFVVPCLLRDEHVVMVLRKEQEWVTYLDGREMARLKPSTPDLQSFGMIAFKNKIAFQDIYLRRKE